MDNYDALLAALNAADNEINCLRQQVSDLQQQLRDRDSTIRQAKDITPVNRVSLKRVLILARAAFLDVVKIPKLDGVVGFLVWALLCSVSLKAFVKFGIYSTLTTGIWKICLMNLLRLKNSQGSVLVQT